jgi:hypothetical protein
LKIIWRDTQQILDLWHRSSGFERFVEIFCFVFNSMHFQLFFFGLLQMQFYFKFVVRDMAGVLWPCSCFCFLFLTVCQVSIRQALFSLSTPCHSTWRVAAVGSSRSSAFTFARALSQHLFSTWQILYTLWSFLHSPNFSQPQKSQRWKWSTALLRRCGDNKALRALDVTFESVRYVRIFWLFGDLMALPLRRKLLLGHWKCSPRSSDHDAVERKCGFSLAIDAVFSELGCWVTRAVQPCGWWIVTTFQYFTMYAALVLRGLETMRRIRYLRAFATFLRIYAFCSYCIEEEWPKEWSG